MSQQPMFFETTYAADYIRPVANREIVLQRESDPNLPPSCFSPPLACTTPISPPEPLVTHQRTGYDCGTNQFLPNLCNSHPIVYEDLQHNSVWMQQAGQSPIKSTYQIDYDHLPEYQLGPHPEDTKYYIRECNGTACSGLRCCAGGLCSCQLCPPGESCQYPDRNTEKISRIPKSYITFSHWPERPYQDGKRLTEYQDRISRIGGITQRERIHDHSCCAMPATCHHEFFLKKSTE